MVWFSTCGFGKIPVDQAHGRMLQYICTNRSLFTIHIICAHVYTTVWTENLYMTEVTRQSQGKEFYYRSNWYKKCGKIVGKCVLCTFSFHYHNIKSFPPMKIKFKTIVYHRKPSPFMQ